MFEEDSIENLQQIYDNLRAKDIVGITIRYADGEEDSTNDTNINDHVCDAFMEVLNHYRKMEMLRKRRKNLKRDSYGKER